MSASTLSPMRPCIMLALAPPTPIHSHLQAATCLLISWHFGWLVQTGQMLTDPFHPRALYKILDSCKQLTLAQGAGEEDPSGMVTIVTGLPLDNPSALSGPMQVGRDRARGWSPSGLEFYPHTFPTFLPQAALQAAAHASVDIKNVLDLYKQWKEMG